QYRNVGADPYTSADADRFKALTQVFPVVVVRGRDHGAGADLGVLADRDTAMAVHLTKAVNGCAVADLDSACSPRADVNRILKQTVAADRNPGGVDDAVVRSEHTARTGTTPHVAELEGAQRNAQE